MTPTLSAVMSVALFSLGVTALSAGIWTILAREYQQALKGISAQSNRLHARSLTEIGVVPVMDASTRLIAAVNALIRKQAIRRIQQNLHPGRILCESFVVGDFPGPCGGATAQDHKCRYCTAVEARTIDALPCCARPVTA